jgi:DNA-binding response OmpR family regulator
MQSARTGRYVPVSQKRQPASLRRSVLAAFRVVFAKSPRPSVSPSAEVGPMEPLVIDRPLDPVVQADCVDDDILHFEDLVLDRSTRTVFRAGRPIQLTRTEFNLLELFLSNPRRVLARAMISKAVWGFDFGPTTNTLNVNKG